MGMSRGYLAMQHMTQLADVWDIPHISLGKPLHTKQPQIAWAQDHKEKKFCFQVFMDVSIHHRMA